MIFGCCNATTSSIEDQPIIGSIKPSTATYTTNDSNVPNQVPHTTGIANLCNIMHNMCMCTASGVCILFSLCPHNIIKI